MATGGYIISRRKRRNTFVIKPITDQIIVYINNLSTTSTTRDIDTENTVGSKYFTSQCILAIQLINHICIVLDYLRYVFYRIYCTYNSTCIYVHSFILLVVYNIKLIILFTITKALLPLSANTLPTQQRRKLRYRSSCGGFWFVSSQCFSRAVASKFLSYDWDLGGRSIVICTLIWDAGSVVQLVASVFSSLDGGFGGLDRFEYFLVFATSIEFLCDPRIRLPSHFYGKVFVFLGPLSVQFLRSVCTC